VDWNLERDVSTNWVVCCAQHARWTVLMFAAVSLYVVPLLIQAVSDDPSLSFVP
jgi:hypothetical protein